MKKLFVILICILTILPCAACSGSQSTRTAEQPGAEAAASQSPETVITAEENGEDSAEEAPAGEPAETADAQNARNNADESGDDEANSKVLTAYFSATGTTKGVAEKIAEAAGADLYEIVPAQPYTDEDLDYNSDSSRTTVEHNDESSRPEISGEISDWGSYETVYLGYPIWWGEAPRIMDTFVETYNFDGKTVIPFCTSGGSGVGASASNLAALANGGDWLSGTRFNGSVSEQEIEEWIAGLGTG